MPSLLTISQLKKAARTHSNIEAQVHAQIAQLTLKETSNGKPFYEVLLRDEIESMTLRAWSDTAAFESCASRTRGDFVEIDGVFSHTSAFGLDARGWELEALCDEAVDLLLEGSREHREILDKAWSMIIDSIESIIDPRLKQLCNQFLSQHGLRFRRAAAARSNHHARRGGLLEHTSRMMECALALSNIYPEINQDLLLAGVLFHDTGKLWETCPPERGFGIETELRGELLGHLSIGIELVNALWRELSKEGWELLSPTTEEVRLHLLHLIAAHHGQLEFGSPVLPKTPEATLLHFIDNIDARLEIFSAAYQSTSQQEQKTYTPLDWVRPLGVSPVPSLAPTEFPTPPLL